MIICAAFFAVLSVGAIAASSALATDEWEVGAKLVGATESDSTVVEGKWLLLALGFFGTVKIHIECSGKLIGTVGGLNANGKGTDTVTAIEGLSGEKGTIKCTILSGEAGPCVVSAGALVTGVNLPWKTELFLEAGDTTPRDAFTASTGEPGFTLECKESSGSTLKETCEGNVKSNQLTNEANGTIKGVIPETNTKKCNNGTNTGHVKGEGILKTLSGATIAAK